MVDWNNPQTILAESLSLVKLIHVVDGIYIWEYFTQLWFEWEIATRRRPWKWTMLVYIITRLSALGGVCAELIGFNLTHEFNCHGWLLAVLITSYISFALNSFLILIRTVAVWNRNVPISLFLAAVWLTNVAFLIYGVTLADSVWLPTENACFIVNSQKSRLNVLISAVTDLILLFFMIIGVMRVKSNASIWWMLYRHGMIWIVLATVGQVPPTTFLFLNLNEAMNLMFQTPALVIMTICSTRLYLSLQRFGHRPMAHDEFLTSAPLASVPPPGSAGRRGFSNGTATTPSLVTDSTAPTGTTGSLDVEFPTSYGRYRAEDLEMVEERLKAIREEGDEDSEEAEVLRK
ncbi:hypothetical protein BC834DRAFT_861584 [Gloeopeniophorella convolvens]|nr:hypothetical protein BC834DRAFT_861584 [Gloeopeniophorella convolvens]